jgi:hypothetical protein
MTDLPDLVAWLRAQIDEDERAAQAAYDEASDYRVVGSRLAEEHFVLWKPDRVLAEVAAKRRFIEVAVGAIESAQPLTGDRILRLLAQPFAGKEGFREEWRV